MYTARLSGAFLILLLAACGGEPHDEATQASSYASTYTPAATEAVAIVNATALTGTGERIDAATIVMMDGRINAVGADLAPPRGAIVVDAAGKWVTPGIIDVHSHLGVYPSPSVAAHSDGNEATDPVTAAVWAEHSVWPQDPGFSRALVGRTNAGAFRAGGRVGAGMRTLGAAYAGLIRIGMGSGRGRVSRALAAGLLGR